MIEEHHFELNEWYYKVAMKYGRPYYETFSKKGIVITNSIALERICEKLMSDGNRKYFSVSKQEYERMKKKALLNTIN